MQAVLYTHGPESRRVAPNDASIAHRTYQTGSCHLRAIFGDFGKLQLSACIVSNPFLAGHSSSSRGCPWLAKCLAQEPTLDNLCLAYLCLHGCRSMVTCVEQDRGISRFCVSHTCVQSYCLDWTGSQCCLELSHVFLFSCGYGRR